MINMAWIGGGMAVVAIIAYLAWDYIKPIFKDSEVLLFGRLQTLLGVLMLTDLAPIVPPDWLPYYVLASGVITEIARRHRATDL